MITMKPKKVEWLTEFPANYIAPIIIAEVKAEYAEWEEECRRDREDGYRPHHCFHGTNQWTDYDNICGWCEEGYGVYETAMYRIALVVREWKRRTKGSRAAIAALREGGDALDGVVSRLIDWASEPTHRFMKIKDEQYKRTLAREWSESR